MCFVGEPADGISKAAQRRRTPKPNGVAWKLKIVVRQEKLAKAGQTQVESLLTDGPEAFGG